MTVYEKALAKLEESPKSWAITGVAGFIGSNLLEHLLVLNQKVVGMDNFSTGFNNNLEKVRDKVSRKQWKNFSFIEGDVRSSKSCASICSGVDYVLHQAALGSVPRSINDPQLTNENNINGHLNMMIAAKDASVESFTYAASSSTYGDHPALPKIEENIGKPLSPYAVTKLVNELYANVFAKTYNFNCIGLRYFNVFGKQQNPTGAYAAVIPKWITALLEGKQVTINGDGSISRDFCYIKNVVQANILAATANNEAKNNIYNISYGQQTSLKELHNYLIEILQENKISVSSTPIYGENRPGDILHSLANINKASEFLGYSPKFSIQDGLRETIPWYIENLEA